MKDFKDEMNKQIGNSGSSELNQNLTRKINSLEYCNLAN